MAPMRENGSDATTLPFEEREAAGNTSAACAVHRTSVHTHAQHCELHNDVNRLKLKAFPEEEQDLLFLEHLH